MGNDIQISEVHKITYLNDQLKVSLNDYVIKDVINIIIEYFFKCSKCYNYFEEISTCADCKYIFCKYCYFKYVSNTYCNNCINVNEKNVKAHWYKCFIENCTNDAMNGDENMPYYCRFHSKNKLLVNYYFDCDVENCKNIGYYTNINYWKAYCNDHKPNNYRLLLIEGIAGEHKNNVQCDECSNKYVIIIPCSCGLKRCLKCFQKVAFYQTINDKVINKCNRCIHLINISLRQDGEFSGSMLDQFCSIYTCTNQGEYFSNNGYLCNVHRNKDSTHVKKFCKRDYCCARRTTKKFCDVHNEEYIHLCKMANDNSDDDN